MHLRYVFDWSTVFAAPYGQWLVEGAEVTLAVTAITSVTSLALGGGLALARLSSTRATRGLANGYAEVVRNIPALFWLLFFYYVFPELLPSAWGHRLHAWLQYNVVAAVVGLTIDNATYVSDIVKAGLAAVPAGQSDAARAIGLSSWGRWRDIVLPQASRVIAGPLTTRMLHNFKNTALCSAITVPDITWATQQIESITFRGIEVTIGATLFYVTVALLIATLARRLERRATANPHAAA